MDRADTPQANNWWGSPCLPAAKVVMLTLLIACFAIQTALVYSDEPGAVRLTGDALRGQRIWRQNNCQSCHQLYGFGGFLGPDLTNASARLTPEWLSEVLVAGVSQMPAYRLPKDDIDAISAYLAAVDQTGRGQARSIDQTIDESGLPRAFIAAVQSRISSAADSSVREGFELVEQRACWSCHAPLKASSAGAPDLSKTALRVDREAILDVLESGRRSMPPTGFNADARVEVVEFLGWLAERRSDLMSQLKLTETGKKIIWSETPWWEFR